MRIQERLASADANTSRRPRLRSALIIFAAVTVILYWRPLFGRGDLIATDILRPLPPWSASTPADVIPYNWILGDTIDNYADLHFYFSHVRSGDVPLWNPHIAGGVPQYVTQVYYPLNAVFLFLPMHYALGVHAALRTFLGMLFMFLFLRELGVRHRAGIVAGVAYGLAAFNIVWLGWQQSWVSVLIPALFWAAERIVRKPTGARGMVLAVVWGSMILGGFPAVAGHAVYALGAYLALRAWMLRRETDQWWVRLRRAGTWIGAGFVLGTLASAIFILPFADYYKNLDTSYRSGLARGSLSPQYLVTAIAPNAYGHHYRPNNWWGPTSNYVEVQLYAGIFTLLLAASSLFLPRKSRTDGPSSALALFFLIMATLSLMIVFGKPFWLLDKVARLPIFSNSAPGRLRDLWNFGAAAAAGLGLHAWGSFATGRLTPARFRRAAIGCAIAAPVIGVIVVLMVNGPWHSYITGVRDEKLVGFTIRQFAIAGGFVVGGVILLGITAFRPRARIVEYGALALVAADLLLFAYPYWPVVSHEHWYPVTAAHRALDADMGNDRMLSMQWAFYPNSNVVYEQPNIRGHVFYDVDHKNVLTSVDPYAFRPGAPTQPYVHPETSDLSAPWLDRLSVRTVALDSRVPPILVKPQRTNPATSSRGLSTPFDVALPVLPQPFAGVDLMVESAPAKLLAGLRVDLIDPSGTVVGSATRRAQSLRGKDWRSWILPTTKIDRPGYRLRITPEGTFLLGWWRDSQDFRPVGGAPAMRLLTPMRDDVFPVYGDDIVLYRRTSALPRARFTGSWVVDGASVLDLAQRPATAPVSLARDPGVPSSAAGGTARIVVDEPDRVVVKASSSGPGLVVLADRMYPGWQATVDGKPAPIIRADRILRAVAVPAGEHTVVFSFKPRVVRRGALVTVAALVAMAAIAAVLLRREREARAAASV